MSGKNSGEAVQLTYSIKFINADCMDIMSQYPDKYFDLAIVDPPYGMGMDGTTGFATKKTHGFSFERKIYKQKKWDKDAPTSNYFKELIRVSKHQIIWGANYFQHDIPILKNFICWYKKGKSADTKFNECELAYTSKGITRLVDIWWNGLGSVNSNEERIHPTQKPVKLYQWIYHNYAKPEYKILDTHLGSGSNAIAAHNYGISEFVGIELDPEYYTDSIKRFNRVTAQLRMF